MKRKFVFFMLLCVLVGVIGCVGLNVFADIIELHLIESELKNYNRETFERKVLTDDVLEARIKFDKGTIKDRLADEGYYLDDINVSLDKYIEISIMYDMSDVENEYIMKLVDLGYDFEKIVELYDFVKKTNENIVCIKDLYDISSENVDDDSWIENAYDLYLGENKCVLQPEDIYTYVNNGISIDEILMCYELSLSNEKNIKQMMDERISGQSWEVIVFPTVYQRSITKNIDLKTITAAINISRQTGMDMDSILNVDDNGEIIIAFEAMKKMSEKKEKIIKTKEKYGVVSYDDVSIIKEAKKQLKNIDSNQIENLISQGYRIREIKEAVEGRNINNYAQIMGIINNTED